MRSLRGSLSRRSRVWVSASAALLMLSVVSYSSVFGTLKAIVHDPEHRPVSGAKIVLRSRTSSFTQDLATDENGLATLLTLPVGVYDVTVSVPGFQSQTRAVTIASDSTQELHFALQIATVQQNVSLKS